MPGVDAVVPETSLVLQLRVEYVGLTERGTGIEIVVESSRSFAAAAAGRLENSGVSAWLNLVAVAGEGRIFV